MNRKTLWLAGVVCVAGVAALLFALRSGGNDKPKQRTSKATNTGGHDHGSAHVGTTKSRPHVDSDSQGNDHLRDPNRPKLGPNETIPGKGNPDLPPPPNPSKENTVILPKPKVMEGEHLMTARKRAVSLLDSRIAALERQLAEAKKNGDSERARQLEVRLERTKKHRSLRADQVKNPPAVYGIEAGDAPGSHKKDPRNDGVNPHADRK